MSKTAAMMAQKRAQKRKRREEKLATQGKLAEKRLTERGSPNYGYTEREFAKMRIQVADLVRSNNVLVDRFSKMDKSQVIERAMESHFMCQALAALLCEKGVLTLEEFHEATRGFATEGTGFVDKPGNPAIVEPGDHLMIKWCLFENGEVVFDDRKDPVMVQVGSGAIPGDLTLVGARVGETRWFDTQMPEKFIKRELVGKPLQAQVTVVGIKWTAQQANDAANLAKQAAEASGSQATLAAAPEAEAPAP